MQLVINSPSHDNQPKIEKELKKDQARARRLKRKEEQEARQIKELEGELKSEAGDKKIMVEELERIEKEKKFIAATPGKEEAGEEAEKTE